MPIADRWRQAGLKACATGAIVASAFGAHSAATGRPVPPAAPVAVASLRTEYQSNPLGLDVKAPRLFWQVQADRRGVMQAAYEIRVAASERDLARKGGALWDSGRVASDQSTGVVYAGPALQSSRRYFWQVRIWDETGAASAWSAAAWWEMGLLTPSDWTAQWIAPANEPGPTAPLPSPMLRREFTIDGDVVSARAYVTSHGLYELYLNGRRVGDQVFTPGWTSYNKHLQYQTYDVSTMLKKGPFSAAAGIEARSASVASATCTATGSRCSRRST